MATYGRNVKLYGPAEVMERLGISRQRLTQLQARPTFPQPLDKIAAGYIWAADDIEAWIKEHRPERIQDEDTP